VALILDTGPIYASLDRRDHDHRRCRHLIEETEEQLVIPSAVLPEVDYLVSQRMGSGPMLALLRDIESGAYSVCDLNTTDMSRVRELMDRYADSDIGYVDACVVSVAELLGEKKLATLDHRHFSIIRPRHTDAFQLLP
jgi:predicted nucleic acid-binding protein